MNRSKKNIISVIFLSAIAVLLVIICIFSNAMFYTSKEFADRTITNKISSLNTSLKNVRKKTAGAFDFVYLKENSVYTADFNIDKRFAYENNFPYFESLSASLTSFSDDSGSSYNSIKVSNSGKVLVEADTITSQDRTVLAIPSLVNGYYLSDTSYIEYTDSNDFDDEDDYEDYDFDDNYNSQSLLTYMLRYSSLDPDSFGDLGVELLGDVFRFLPDEAYFSSIGAFGKSSVVISASEPELTQAVYKTIQKNASNEKFKQMITSSFPGTDYERFIASFLEGLNELECSTQNLYTVGFQTNIAGQIKQLTLSYMIEGKYNSIIFEFGKNKATIKIKNNDRFESDVKEFSERSYEVVYGVSKDKSIKGYIQYTESGGSALIYFDGLKLSNGFIDGTISLARTDDEDISAVFNSANKDILISYNRAGEPLANLHIYREKCVSAPFKAEDIETGQIYRDMSDYTEDVLSSDGLSDLSETLQIEQFDSWVKTLAEMYLSEV